jgi:hypothetical protein
MSRYVCVSIVFKGGGQIWGFAREERIGGVDVCRYVMG